MSWTNIMKYMKKYLKNVINYKANFTFIKLPTNPVPGEAQIRPKADRLLHRATSLAALLSNLVDIFFMRHFPSLPSAIVCIWMHSRNHHAG